MKKIFLTIGILFLFCNTSDARTLGSIDGQGSYGSKVISALPNPLAHYKLNDNAATKTVIDATGNHNGTSVRNTSLMSVAGKIGTALDFDGADDYINLSAKILPIGDATICCWIYPEGYGEGGLGQIVNENNAGMIFGINTTKESIKFSSAGNSVIVYSADNSIELDKEQFLCAARKANGKATFYINKEVSGNSNQSSGTPAHGSSNTRIGNFSTIWTFDGYIDDVRIYDRILTQRQISKIYNGGRGTER